MSSRAARLAAIKRQLAVDLGYDPDTISGADAERVSHAALLRLQYEVASGKLIEGGSVASDELIRLTEAVANVLPTKAPQRIEVHYVDTPEHPEEARLRERISELERQLADARSQAPAPANSNRRHPARNGFAHPEDRG